MKKFLSAISLLFLCLLAQAQYNSILWKIEGHGLKKPSYLFGTMHTSDARAFRHVQAADLGFKKTEAYAMELDPEKVMDMSLLSKVMMGKGYSLKKMMHETDYNLLDSLAKSQLGLSVALFDNVQPVFIMNILETSSIGLSDSSTEANTQIMDLYFYEQAKKTQKMIIGIETVEEQLSALNSQSYEEQAKLLVDELHSMQRESGDGQNNLHYYIAQHLDSLAAETKDMPAVLYKALVADRNVRMAERIGSFVQKRPTFIAIGALHLPGVDGVIELLRKQGFTVSPVKN